MTEETPTNYSSNVAVNPTNYSDNVAINPTNWDSDPTSQGSLLLESGSKRLLENGDERLLQ